MIGIAYALCRFLLMLIPPSVPSIEVDTSDGNIFSIEYFFCDFFFS